MRIVVVADLHGHAFREFDYIDPRLGFSRRLADALSVISSAVEQAEEESAENIVFVGDLFHKMGILEVETFNLIFAGVKEAAQSHKIHILRGNHDTASKDGSIHSLEAFREIRNVEVYSEEEATQLRDGDEKLRIVFLPYDDNHEAAQTWAKKLRSKEGIAFMHHGFKGAVVGSTLEKIIKEPLDPQKIAKCFPFTYSGHYHKQQFVHHRVMYVGSPMEHTRSDIADYQKGIIVVDTEKVDSPKHVPLQLPRFVSYQHGHKAVAPLKGNYVDYQLGRTEKASDAAERLKAAGARGWNLHPYIEPARALSKTEKRVKVAPGMSMTRLIKKAVKKRCPRNLDKTKLLKLMQETLKEAEELE